MTAHYHDMRTPRTHRSEFRSAAKLAYRPMQRIDVPRHEPEVSALKVTLGFIALACLAIIGLCWDSAPVQGFVALLRPQS